MNQFARSTALLGEAAIERLKNAHVAVFGIGGVGSYAAEALARAGIGTLTLTDNDCVSLTNLNRQLYALHSTIGQPKVLVAAERIHDINPDCRVSARQEFYLPENAPQLLSPDFDYIIDAVDTVAAKLDLACRAAEMNIPIISCMGTGNKLDASLFQVTDLFKTSVCPLCRVMRRELKKRGLNRLKVVYSPEPPLIPSHSEESGESSRVPGSVSFVPPVAGLLLAGEVVRNLTEVE